MFVRFHFGRCDLSDSGDIAIDAPWAATRLTVQAPDEPPSLVLPERFKFSRDRQSGKDERSWILRDRLDDLRVTFGRIDVRAGSIQTLQLIDIPIPADSPIKMHWQAPQILDGLLAPVKAKEDGANPKIEETRQAATEAGMEPRCTGMCSAWASISPLAVKTAAEQSALSFMLGDRAECLSTVPISSATEESR